MAVFTGSDICFGDFDYLESSRQRRIEKSWTLCGRVATRKRSWCVYVTRTPEIRTMGKLNREVVWVVFDFLATLRDLKLISASTDSVLTEYIWDERLDTM